MDSEDICLSVFLCICVGEGIGDKSKSIYPLVFTDEGIGDKSKSIYPLVFTDEGIGDKSKSIYPLVFSDGAYYGKILIYAPISCQRRGLLRQNSFLRSDIPVSTGLITAKSLSAPRYPGIDGVYYGKIPFCAPIFRY